MEQMVIFYNGKFEDLPAGAVVKVVFPGGEMTGTLDWSYGPETARIHGENAYCEFRLDGTDRQGWTIYPFGSPESP